MMFIELNTHVSGDPGITDNYKPVLFNVNTITVIQKSPMHYEDNAMVYVGDSGFLVRESYETIVDLLYDNVTCADLMIFSTTEEEGGRKESE